MRLGVIPVYGRHGSYMDSGPHSFVKVSQRLVDVSAFLSAGIAFADATYPQEPDRGHDPLVSASFGKGSAVVYVDLPSSELARTLGYGTSELARTLGLGTAWSDDC